MKRPALQNNWGGVLRKAFRPRKVFGTFEKQAPAMDDVCSCFARGLNVQVSYQLRSLFRFCVVEVIAILATCLVNDLGERFRRSLYGKRDFTCSEIQLFLTKLR